MSLLPAFFSSSVATNSGKFTGRGNAPMRKVRARSFNLRKMKYSWLDGTALGDGPRGGHFSDKDDVLWAKQSDYFVLGGQCTVEN